MLSDLNSELYSHLRGAIAVLVIFHLINYFRSREHTYIYYSLYFFFSFLFFLKEVFKTDLRNFLTILDPSIHYLTFIFYIQFARYLLRTKEIKTNLDTQLVYIRKLLVLAIPTTLFLHAFFGFEVQKILFFIVSPIFSLFALYTYYKLLMLKNNIAYYFVSASLLYFFLANIALIGQIIFSIEGFIYKFNIHPTFFVYAGVICEALVFANLIGLETKKIKKINFQVRKEKENIEQEYSILIKSTSKKGKTLKNGRKILFEDLIYLKSEDHYVTYHIRNNNTITIRESLKHALEHLTPNFKRCHRSYIVNVDFISYLNTNSIILSNKTQIPVSRNYKQELEDYHSRH